MRSLPLSLLGAVLSISLGLGWLFDTLYSRLNPEGEPDPETNLALLQDIGASLATSLAQVDDKTAFVQAWENNLNIEVEIIALEDIALPDSMSSQLQTGKPLMLEREAKIALYYLLNTKEGLLKTDESLLKTKQSASSEANSINELLHDASQLLVLSVPRSSGQQHSHHQIRWWLTFGFYFCLLLLLTFWLYPLISRLRILRRSAMAFGRGDLHERIPLSGLSYIRDIEREFNRMAQQIEALISDVKLLSSAVSHDLRTPIAKIRLGIDLLEEASLDEKQRKYLARMSSQVDDMTDLVENLLRYARLDQVLLDVQLQPLDLSTIVKDAVQKYCGNSKQWFDRGLDKSCMILGEKRYLKMLLTNLFENAAAYAESKIQVSISTDEKVVTLLIEDDGPGVEEALRETLFKPFVRGEYKSGKPKGYGLGLAFVKRVADWHDATISVSDSPALGGALFLIQFPLSR